MKQTPKELDLISHLRSGARDLPKDFLNQWLRWEMADGSTLKSVPENTEKRYAV